MKSLLSIVFGLIALSFSARAQSLNVFNIDASGFPVIKAKFRATDKDGNSVRNLTPGDFTITENGISRAVTKISCPPVSRPPALSSVLTMDVSGSMSFGLVNVSNLELAKTAARAWIEGLPGGRSECAITAFNDENYFIQDFTVNKQKLLDALQKLGPAGGTDYNKGFSLLHAGGLEVIKQGKHKRVLIFLSDGMPNFPPDENAIVALANQLQATIFCVTLGLPMPEVLKNIANKTGGEWYENVTTQTEAEDTYRKILGAALGAEPCEIEWLSAASCTSQRIVNFSLPIHNLTSELSYKAPLDEIITLETKPVSIKMGKVKIGEVKDTLITITARKGSIEIKNIIASNPNFTIMDYGGSNPPFTLKENESRVFKVRFTAQDSLKFYTRIKVVSTSCTESNIYLSGGFPGKEVSEKSLKLTHPNGGEVFLVGSDTVITWEGVSPEDTVNLSIKYNKNGDWENITTKATNLRFAWEIPDHVSDECLVQVSKSLQNNLSTPLAKSAGAEGVDVGIAIAADQDGNVIVCGYSTSYNEMNFGNNMSLYINGGFLVKYDSNGKALWAKALGGRIIDRTFINQESSVSVDGFGNIYVGGSFDAVLTKYSPDGTLLWSKKNSSLPIRITSVSVDNENNVYICGAAGGFMDSTVINFGSGVTFKVRTEIDAFTAKCSNDGTFLWARKHDGKESSEEVANSISRDVYGNVVITGSYGESIDFGNGNLIPASKGHYDGFLVKYNTDGSTLWAAHAGGIDEDRFTSISSDEEGNSYVCGYFVSNTINFGNNITLSNSGMDDSFLAKYDANGQIIWAKKIAGDHIDQAKSVTTDYLGYIYISGFSRSGNLEFGEGTKLINPYPPREDGFLAKYDSYGTLIWAKRVGSTWADIVNCTTTDFKGNIYITGFYAGRTPLDLGNGTQLTGAANEGEVFFARYNAENPIEQSDTSDAVFSIVKPLAASQNIDMGRVLVTSSKDSLIQSFITNTGSYPIRIDAINIAGINASDFQLVSGIPPFTIPVGDKRSVEFRFRPSAIGPRSADLAVITQADTLHQSIIGEGVKPVIQVTASLIDFGIMEVGSLKDTTVTAVLKNIGDVPLAITNTQMLGPDKEQFEIISGGGSFTLASGATQTMQLRFSPKYIGRTSGQIGFDYDGMAGGRPAVVQLFGQGIGGNVYVVDDSAYIGETRDIQLMLGKVKPASVAQVAATSFRATLAFKNSILTPASAALLNDAVFKKGLDTDTLTVTQQWSAQTSELARIPFIATLGDRLSTDIELLEFDWLDDSGSRIDYDTELQSGVFTVLGICPEGGDRLFDAEGEAQMMLVMPNPVNTTAEIRFKTIEKGHTLITLTDVLGRQIELVSGDYSSGEHSVEIQAGTLTQGIYFLTMQTPTQVFTQRVVVEK